MNISTIIRTFVAVVVVAGALAVSALAAAEPKNTLPFTRAVGSDRVAALVVTLKHASSAPASGEAKNVLPFSRR